jgi:hypothetical protein
VPDATIVRRALGMKAYRGSDSTPRRQENLTYDLALRIAEALNLDPVDVGL